MRAKANWLDPSTTAENEILPKYLKWAWMSRGLSLALNVILIMQLTYYCTDMLAMPALGMGTLLLASKLFDGVTDVAVGFIIDKTHTRFGKARPYEFSIIFVWLLTVLLFSVPASMNLAVKYVYVFVLYTLINSIFATALNGSDAVYLARAIRSEKNRVSLMSFNGAVIMIFSIATSILMPQLIAGIGATRGGWTLIAVSFAVPLAVIGMFRFLFVKEVALPESGREQVQQKSVSLGTSLRCLFRNKYIFLFAGMTLSVSLLTTIGSSVNTYYFKYIVGNIGLASVVGMSGLVTPLVLVFFPLLSRKVGMVRLLKIGTVFGMIGYGIRIVGGTNLATLTLGSLVSSMAVLPVTMMGNIYLIECMDYGEWKTGVRIEGILASVNGFCSKLGSGVASSLVGIIMGLAGYNGALEVQSAEANISIIALFNYLPLLLMALMLVLAMLYKLDQQMPQIKAELAKRRSGQQT